MPAVIGKWWLDLPVLVGAKNTSYIRRIMETELGKQLIEKN